jgi:hypothetical protein
MIKETPTIKICNTPNYKYIFNKIDGKFIRWGETLKDNPEYSPVGPELLDIEISTICHQGCAHCYKSNTSKGENMSFETYKQLFSKFPQSLTQVAFGIGSIDANPDLWKILKYTRDNGIIPNITINGSRMTPEYYDLLVKYCGAVAVSCYDKDICYNTIKELTDRGLKQVNIHALLAEETYSRCLRLIEDSKNDERLIKLNAIVFLFLKPKGKRNNFHKLEHLDLYKFLINYSFQYGARIGFDSCSAPAFIKAIKNRPDFEHLETLTEPCESTLFSLYINTFGLAFPCSFCEGEGIRGINVLKCGDFLKDVWFKPQTAQFRKKLLDNKDENGCRNCPQFNLGMK